MGIESHWDKGSNIDSDLPQAQGLRENHFIEVSEPIIKTIIMQQIERLDNEQEDQNKNKDTD